MAGKFRERLVLFSSIFNWHKLKCVNPLSRRCKWAEWDKTTNDALQRPTEQLPAGTDLVRKDWVALNRARAKVGNTATNLFQWKLAPGTECPCGHPRQTVDHIMSECSLGPHCTDADLRQCNQAAREARYAMMMMITTIV